jgi:steroid delta-isomerase-like uncharacterized protein
MEPIEIAREYFEAWNRHDPAAIVALFAEGGIYRDPAVASGLAGPAIGDYAGRLFAGFPDLRFEVLGAVPGDGGTVAARWLMRGTNTEPLADKPATGRAIALPGADFIAVENGKILSVDGYFDQKTMAKQLGLQVLVQPHVLDTLAFGSASRMDNGKRTKPGAIVLTWIQVNSEQEAHEIRHRAIRITDQITTMPGFLSYAGFGVGERLFTVTAWEDPESPRQLLRGGEHREMMHKASGPAFSAAFHTSVWVPHHLNPMWVRCTACGKMADYERLEGQCECGAALPEHPPYW